MDVALARRVSLGGDVPLGGQSERYAAREDILPRVLLRAQGGRRSKDFWGLQQQNKQLTHVNTHNPVLLATSLTLCPLWSVGACLFLFCVLICEERLK